MNPSVNSFWYFPPPLMNFGCFYPPIPSIPPYFNVNSDACFQQASFSENKPINRAPSIENTI